MKICHLCSTTLPDNARFCYNCGAPQAVSANVQRQKVRLNGDVAQQIFDQFFPAFRERIEAEHHPAQLQLYAARLNQSGFEEVVQYRATQLTEQIKYLDSQDLLPDKKLNSLIDNAFEDMLDYFIIHFCKDINEIPLPENILNYQNVSWQDVNRFQMIMDYLDFEQESETVYTDFLAMPIEKLRNASKSYLFPQPQERIFFICDQSILGSAKEGFALTERAVYWKAHLEKSRRVPFDSLLTFERKKDWITINGAFFNVNPSINLKLLKLLKKIKRLHDDDVAGF